MKTVKNDTRYIIKKIIIGVGIALILAFLKTNNVFADSIANNYCYKLNYTDEIIDCSTQDISNYEPFQIGIKSTPVGDDVFTFYFYPPVSTNHYEFSFGFENIENGDLLLINQKVYSSTFFTQIGFMPASSGANLYTYNGSPTTDFSASNFNFIYITEDYSRAYDLVNNPPSWIKSSPTPYLSNVNTYYFVSGVSQSSYNFYNLFGGIQPSWVYNRLNGDTTFLNNADNFDTTLHFFDENGDLIGDIQHTEESFNLPFVEDYWLQGFQDSGDTFTDDTCSNGGICAENILTFIDFLKMPFNFLKSLNRNSCEPISIPFPFTNSSIQLNCLSSIFSSVLGNFYSVLFYIITGLYAYRITILNIDTITDVFNPEDDKLEVVDL